MSAATRTDREKVGFAGTLANASHTAFGTTETIYIAVLLVILFATFSSLNAGFYSGSNLSTIAQTAAFTGIIGVGMTLVLVTGEIDLSVGSMAGLGAITGALVMQHTGSVALGVIAGILSGVVIGLINGVLVVFVGLPSFIVTLGMLFAARGLAYVLSGADQVYPLPAGVASLSSSLVGVPISVIILIVVVVVGDWVLRRSGYGRRAYAVGGNSRATVLSGIRPSRVKLAAFVATATLAAVTGVLQMSLLKSGDPQIGTGLEFSVIAAVVVGGVGLTGGRGTVAGGVLGVLFVQVVTTGLVVSGMDSSLQPAVLGVIMIAALSLKRFVRQ